MRAGKGGGYRKPMGSEVRRVKESWTETDPDPVEEARGHEKRMLDSFVAATASLEWLGTHEGWKLLGFDTCAEWWGARVQPVVEALGLAPTKELGQKVIGLIRAEEAALPRAQQRSARELAALVGVSEWAARTPTPRSSSSRNHERDDLEGTTETSGAVPPASTEDASPVLGEPDVDVQAASTSGTQTAAGPEVEVAPSPADETAAGTAASAGRAGGQTPARPVPTDSPAADSLPPQAHAGVPAVGGQTEERIEEEAAEPPVDTPAAGVTSLPDGEGDPTPEPEQQPGQDSPTGLEAAQPRDDRSETDSSAGPDQPVATTVLPGIDHHDGAGVSLSGEALPVESAGALLEDGDAAVTPSSSDYLMHLFASLVHGLSGLDAEALGPQLLGEEMELLHQHVDDITHFVSQLGRARFTEMTRTP